MVCVWYLLYGLKFRKLTTVWLRATSRSVLVQQPAVLLLIRVLGRLGYPKEPVKHLYFFKVMSPMNFEFWTFLDIFFFDANTLIFTYWMVGKMKKDYYGFAVFFKVFMIFEYVPLFFFLWYQHHYLLAWKVSLGIVNFASFANYFLLCTVVVLTVLLSWSWFSNFGA